VAKDEATTGEGEAEQSNRERIWTTAERTTFVVSLIIVVALAAVAVVEYLNQPAEETAVFEITVEGEQARRQDESYAIPFSVANVGRSGARDVTVRFEIVSSADGEVVDELTITIDVLPVRGVEEGQLLISQDPATHTVTGRVLGYFLP
jgi:uncharacterized protein (TIGR02588 family)